MTKLDEMIETFQVAVTAAKSGFASGPSDEDLREGMRAVLRKHIEPLIAEAFEAGTAWRLLYPQPNERRNGGREHAARITTAIVEQADEPNARAKL